MHRFFVPPHTVREQPVTLTGDQAHQIRRVLRMRLGDRAILLDNVGWAYEAILVAVGEGEVKFQTLRRSAAGGEPRTQIVLFQAVLKRDRFAWALQKGVEVGVSVFVPTICERNVVDDLAVVEAKRARWERIIQEAAEQCGRARLPELAPPQPFAQAVLPGSVPCDPATPLLRLIPWEEERSLRLRDALTGCNFTQGACIQVYVGPEGGFTPAEVRLAQRHGIQPVTLGDRILRAETAGIVAAIAILYEAGEI